MNPEDHLQTILRVKVGSHLYNLATEKSDEDFRGVVVCTHPDYLFGLRNFEQITTLEPDEVKWNLLKFIKLALSCNTVALEVLFAPDNYVLECNEFGQLLRGNKEKFLSKRIYNVIKGYAYDEYRRALGETTGKLGNKRKQELEKYGYSRKNASHCLRLLKTGINLFLFNQYQTSWYKDEQCLLMDFKTGQYKKHNFEYWFLILMNGLEKAFENTKLPDNSDETFIHKITTEYLETLV